jgi:protein-tyrosine sulfotransferase
VNLMTKERDRGVVIVGHPRSGTTLLRRWIDAHPDFTAPPETHLLSAAGRFLHADKTALGVDMGVLAGLNFAGFDDSIVLKRLRDFVVAFLDEYALSQNAKRWVEKTAFDVFFLEKISDLLQDTVQYVGVVRHPLDVAISTAEFCDKAGLYPDALRGFVQQSSSPLAAFITSWAVAFKNLKKLSERYPANFVMLRYEDMVQNPEAISDGLYNFLGAEPPKERRKLGGTNVFGFSDHRTFEIPPFDVSRISRWAHLPANQVIELTANIQDLMTELGYESVTSAWIQGQDEARQSYVLGQRLKLSP